MNWRTSRHTIPLDRPLVMGILNVTPDSFSDGGEFATLDDAVRRGESMIADGADIIDVGGESTRPGSQRVTVEEEIKRVIPIIKAITSRFDTPVSVDTTKADVARVALDAGAEIINDISGMRWDGGLASLAAETGAGLVLMHSRGEFETMHTQSAVDDIVSEVCDGLRNSVALATASGVTSDQIVLDVGIGFSKTQDQNLELLAKLDRIVSESAGHPVLVGTSRKSFIAKVLGDTPPEERLAGSLSTALYAVIKGAAIVRVHDVRPHVEALRMLASIEEQKL